MTTLIVEHKFQHCEVVFVKTGSHTVQRHKISSIHLEWIDDLSPRVFYKMQGFQNEVPEESCFLTSDEAFQ